nr:acyl carrier protein [Paenibacillus oenotherae]
MRKIFAETLNISEEQVTDGLEYNSIPEWDSISHMALIATLDDEFNIMMETEDVIDLSSFAKAKEILSKYGVQF